PDYCFVSRSTQNLVTPSQSDDDDQADACHPLVSSRPPSPHADLKDASARQSRLTLHDLRHEAIRRFFEMGLTMPEVASISGHRDIRMLMRYAHPMRQRIIEQMDKGEPKRGS